MKLINYIAIIVITLTIGAVLIVQGEMGSASPLSSLNSGNIGRFLQSIPWWIYVGIVIFITWLCWYCGSSKCPHCHKKGALFKTNEEPELISRSPRPYWSKEKQCYVYKVTYRINMQCKYCGYETNRVESREVPENEFTE